MGQSPSKPEEKVFLNETPISFSPEVVDQLSERAASLEPTPERQATLDVHIRNRIHNELEKLRSEEEDVKHAIESALEKENLNHERSMAGEAAAGDGSEAGSIKSSIVLMGDLEEIQAKIDRFKSRKALSAFPEVKDSQEAIIQCFKNNPSTTLDCWKEVQKFRTSVGKAEREYFKSLH